MCNSAVSFNFLVFKLNKLVTYEFSATNVQMSALKEISEVVDRIVVVDINGKSLNSKSHFLPGLKLNIKVT